MSIITNKEKYIIIIYSQVKKNYQEKFKVKALSV